MRLGADEARNREGQSWAEGRAGGSRMGEEVLGACLAACPWARTKVEGVAFAAIVGAEEGPVGGREVEDHRPGEARLCKWGAVGRGE